VDAAERFANTLHQRCRSIARDHEISDTEAHDRPKLRVV